MSSHAASEGPLRGYVRLARPRNALLAAAGAWIGGLAALGSATVTPPLVLGAAAAALGTAGANALNDVRDRAIDRTAHPGRPIPRGSVGVRGAMVFFAAAWVLAVAAAASTTPLALLLAATGILLVAAYELVLKDKGLLGHLTVAVTAGLVFPLGAAAASGGHAAAWLMGGIAATAHLGRELFKAAEDRPHDQGRRATFAVRRGARAASRAGAVALLAAVALSPLPHFLAGWPDLYLQIVAAADILFLSAAWYGLSVPWRGRALAKIAMTVALVAFLLGILG